MHFPNGEMNYPHLKTPQVLNLMHRLVDCYGSYFGAFTCVAWSPDGRFILVSGFIIDPRPILIAL
jgi:hypothetical protein